MENELALRQEDKAIIFEKALIGDDLSKMNPAERVMYYGKVCESLGLNPYTKPFAYITLNGKLTLYVKRDATEQLRKNSGISIKISAAKKVDDIYIVSAQASDKLGRTDESIGAVSIKGLAGENLANAYMKAETKAKRRVTLSICGLGWTDESEIETIKDAKRINVDIDTGEIVETLPPAEGASGTITNQQRKQLFNTAEKYFGETSVNIVKDVLNGMNLQSTQGMSISDWQEAMNRMSVMHDEITEADKKSTKSVPLPSAPPEPEHQAESVETKPTGKPITDKQAKRIYAIAKGDKELIETVLTEYGYQKTSQIDTSDYEAICTEIEQGAGQ